VDGERATRASKAPEGSGVSSYRPQPENAPQPPHSALHGHPDGRCAIDWAAFGLGPEHDCANPATAEVSIACVHEHVARSLTCPGCLALLESCGPTWWCPQCYSHPTGAHVCEVQLVAVPLNSPGEAP
jgi:hypothetical protein